jgi:hypothetical protein
VFPGLKPQHRLKLLSVFFFFKQVEMPLLEWSLMSSLAADNQYVCMSLGPTLTVLRIHNKTVQTTVWDVLCSLWHFVNFCISSSDWLQNFTSFC